MDATVLLVIVAVRKRGGRGNWTPAQAGCLPLKIGVQSLDWSVWPCVVAPPSSCNWALRILTIQSFDVQGVVGGLSRGRAPLRSVWNAASPCLIRAPQNTHNTQNSSSKAQTADLQ
jgi:hypothetical protein